MHPIQFGYCVPIFAMPGGALFRTPNYGQLDPATTMALAQSADALGYDSLWVADHLMLGKDEAILEGWTVLAALAASTYNAKLGIIHQAHFFRHPALAAKMTATLDQLSGGRFIYFVSVGWLKREYHAYGLPWHDAFEERFEAMIEGLQVTLALWGAAKPTSFQGRFYQLENAVCTPLPVQKPHPPIWMGEPHPLTYRACAQYAQGWNTVPVTVQELQRRLDGLKVACLEIGRPYDEIEKSLEIQILIAHDRDSLRQKLNAMLSMSVETPLDGELLAFSAGATDAIPPSLADTWLIGTPDEISARLRQYIEMGVTHFMLWFVDAPSDAGMRLFAEQVAPAFR